MHYYKQIRGKLYQEVYMNATKKFRMLSSVFIVLCLLLGTSLTPAYARDPGGRNAAAQISMSGWFSIIWGDSNDGKSSMIYTITDVNGQRTLLQMDETVAGKLGGVLQFNGKYVNVQGTLATRTYTNATSRSTQSPPAVLNVISISLPSSPGSQAPAINDVIAIAAVSGSKPWVTIMCKFSDIAAEPNDRAYFLGMYSDTKPGLNHYWKELSFNTADVTGSTVGTGWYTLPETELHYNPTDTEKGTNLNALAGDCITAADPDVDFSLYSGINMMFNSDFDNGWAWGGGTGNITLDGVTRSWSITWEPPWSYANISVISHEMGHGFGLPHSSYNRAAVYDNAWDVMSQDRYNCAAATDATYGCMAQHTISYHKDLLGWIPGPQKTTVATGNSATVTLEDLAAPASTNYQIVNIPIGGSATNFYTVEARQFTGYDVKLPGEAVIIHNVDTTNEIPAVLVPGGLSSTNPGVMWTVGETFTDSTNNIRVIVNSATATGFEVTISNDANLPPTSEAGGPYTKQCTGPTTSVTLDGRGSGDPEGFPLTYSWSTTCPGGTFDNAAFAQPTLTVNTASCVVSCTVSLTVTDNGGLQNSDTASVTISDTTPPTVTCPSNLTIECSASSGPSNTGTATATDNCIPNPSVSFSDNVTPGSCPEERKISRLWTSIDNCLNSASCSQTINVVDTVPPTLVGVPGNLTVECDAVPTPATVTATDNCDSAVVPSFNQTRVDGSCAGNYTLTRRWTGVDDCGNSSSAAQTITVQDTTPPTITSIAAYPNKLWPVNHKMVPVRVAISASDNCSGAVCSITSVASNEPENGLGDGDMAPDWEITGGLKVNLRAERSGTGNGRIYTLTTTCTDGCGNSSTGIVHVTVPHDQKR
jgi:M6 family metalloprotease-like protein